MFEFFHYGFWNTRQCRNYSRCQSFVKLEAEIWMREWKFLIRPVSVYCTQRNGCESWSSLCDEIWGFGNVKLLGLDTYNTLTMKVKFERHKAFLE